MRYPKEQLDSVSSGGIHLPESVGHVEQTVGEVVAVGPGRVWDDGPFRGLFIETTYKPGDRVLFHLEGAQPIQTSEEQFPNPFRL